MKQEDYRKGLTIKLSQSLRLRCCGCDPVPEGATVVLFDRISPNRAEIGLYFGPESPTGVWHHKVWPIGRVPMRDDSPGLKNLVVPGTGKASDLFPQGGFCLHKVKISGIQGDVTGSVRPEIFEREQAEMAE